jgi:hypothetical protein
MLVLAVLAGCDSCSKAPPPAATETPDAARTVRDRDPEAGPVNVTALPTSSVAAMVNPQNLPPYTGPTGSVEGTIRVVGAPAEEIPGSPTDYKKCPAGAAMFGHAFREGKPDAKGARELADAVVAVTGYSGFYIQENDDAEPLAIENCSFTKRTVTATFGQRIDVTNLTKEFWTPVLEPNPAPALRMAAPGGEPVKLYPKKPGHYHIVDHDRKWAQIDLYVFLHPLHTTSRVDGSYRIDGVPVGKLKVNTSHPRIPDAEASAEVEIKSGVVHHVDLVLENKAPPDAGTNQNSNEYPRLH